MCMYEEVTENKCPHTRTLVYRLLELCDPFKPSGSRCQRPFPSIDDSATRPPFDGCAACEEETREALQRYVETPSQCSGCGVVLDDWREPAAGVRYHVEYSPSHADLSQGDSRSRQLELGQAPYGSEVVILQ